jgi:hypothetical protein
MQAGTRRRPGELYIGGVQVGVGYHRRPELTAERFVPDLFSTVPDARMYRTGDRARWLEDGTIEYLGRVDFQVKLRGFRVEVGEIEAALAAVDGVRDCVVVLRTDAGIEPRLVAYYVLAAGASLSAADLRTQLEQSLPSHMVPWLYVPLDVLPLVAIGENSTARRFQRRRTLASRRETVAPRDEIEAHVLRIWEEVLGVTNIGVTDHFNEVGGHSLACRARVRAHLEGVRTKAPAHHDSEAQHSGAARKPAAQSAGTGRVELYRSTRHDGRGCPDLLSARADRIRPHLSILRQGSRGSTSRSTVFSRSATGARRNPRRASRKWSAFMWTRF